MEVPFKIPTTLLILLVANPSFKVRNIGIPPHTEASNSKLTLFFSASNDRWSPCLEIKALLAVITCFLFFKAFSTIFFDIPSDKPINSITILTFGFFVISNGFLKKIFFRTLKFLFLLIFFADTPTILIFVPVLRPISLLLEIISL